MAIPAAVVEDIDVRGNALDPAIAPGNASGVHSKPRSFAGPTDAVRGSL